jgi:septal ring-binding cell division protein DamX
MRIEQYLTNPSASFPLDSSLQRVAVTGQRTTADATQATSSQVSTSPELTNLLALVRQQPEIRQDVLAQVGQRLANGEYFTSATAAQTAAAMQAATD